MIAYLDASVIVALFTEDPHSEAAEEILRSSEMVLVSDFAAAEFASAVTKNVRHGALADEAAQVAFANFDVWRVKCGTIETHSTDILLAASYLRRVGNTLRMPDAINIAICHRLGCRLATFDRRMAEEAAKLGVPT